MGNRSDTHLMSCPVKATAEWDPATHPRTADGGWTMAESLTIQNPIQSRNCALHRHRSKTATEKHHVWPLGDGGPDTKANLLQVCADGHSEIHQYIALLRYHHGIVPWAYRRLYGKRTREVAMCGWLASTFRTPYPPRGMHPTP